MPSWVAPRWAEPRVLWIPAPARSCSCTIWALQGVVLTGMVIQQPPNSGSQDPAPDVQAVQKRTWVKGTPCPERKAQSVSSLGPRVSL